LKTFLKNIFRRNIYLVLVAAALFLAASLSRMFMDSDTSTRLLHHSIESFLQQRERDFIKTTNNTLFLAKLCNREFSKQQLEELVDKNYALFLYERDAAGNDSLLFWNDQRSIPTAAILNGPDSSSFVRLSNGQYESIKRTLPGADGKTIVAIALIPVRYQYFITNIRFTALRVRSCFGWKKSRGIIRPPATCCFP
jgi:hypothetical protein